MHSKNLFIEEILWISPKSIQNSKTLYICEIFILTSPLLLISSLNSYADIGFLCFDNVLITKVLDGVKDFYSLNNN